MIHGALTRCSQCWPGGGRPDYPAGRCGPPLLLFGYWPRAADAKSGRTSGDRSRAAGPASASAWLPTVPGPCGRRERHEARECPDSMDRAGATMASAPALDVMAVRGIVAEELAARAPVGDAYQVASTVLALQARAAEVVEAETARLGGKLGGLDTRRMPRSPGPSTGWRTTCCTRRQHGSNS